jgi:hypothetical protein
MRLGMFEGNYDTVPNQLTKVAVSHPFSLGAVVPPGRTNAQLLKVAVSMKGNLNADAITNMVFGAKGATALQVLNAKLHYSGDNNDFASAVQIGTTQTTHTNNEWTFTITPGVIASHGTHIF